MSKLSQLQLDVISILEETKEYVAPSNYRCDIVQIATQGYNADGSFTYSTHLAYDSIIKYMKEDSYLLADVVKYHHDTMDMEIGSLLFSNPEAFQVIVLIEIVDRVLTMHDEFSEWRHSDESHIVGDMEAYNSLIDTVINDIETGKFDFDCL